MPSHRRGEFVAIFDGRLRGPRTERDAARRQEAQTDTSTRTGRCPKVWLADPLRSWEATESSFRPWLPYPGDEFRDQATFLRLLLLPASPRLLLIPADRGPL